jgi:hypothetical protein
MQIDRTLGCGLTIPGIALATLILKFTPVIAKDVVCRLIQHTDDEFDVIEGEITAADNEIDSAHAILNRRSIEHWLNFIANDQSAHIPKL